jgi:hypothetical protein
MHLNTEINYIHSIPDKHAMPARNQVWWTFRDIISELNFTTTTPQNARVVTEAYLFCFSLVTCLLYICDWGL